MMRKYCSGLIIMILALSSCHDDIPIYDSYETTTQTLFVYMPWTGSTTSSAYALTISLMKTLQV